ncbi:4871_t:CDS:2 [Cetraspora pellucida]|uniref:4871_t:CDS:1 n=1 Tax=Cetraspora pellucida TaxID=1433469 RepID=A0A9N9AL48_9GLOM|nr:4871_t:CDS:2 [Cetraspora pellucida]
MFLQRASANDLSSRTSCWFELNLNKFELRNNDNLKQYPNAP